MQKTKGMGFRQFAVWTAALVVGAALGSLGYARLDQRVDGVLHIRARDVERYIVFPRQRLCRFFRGCACL